MRLSNKVLALILVTIIFSFNCVFAESNSNDKTVKINNDMLNYVKRNIALSTIQFSKKIKFCDKQRDRIIVLDTDYLKSINVTRNDVLLGFIFLDHNNTFTCQKDAQLQFAYDIGMLVSVQRYYKMDYQESLDIASGLIYPSVEDKLEYLIKYSTLPVELREYLEKIIGDKPFDFVNSIGSIELPRQ